MTTNKETDAMKKNTTQKIEAWLSRGYKLTALQALNKWGCMRLAARIAELRQAGMNATAQPPAGDTPEISTPQ